MHGIKSSKSKFVGAVEQALDKTEGRFQKRSQGGHRRSARIQMMRITGPIDQTYEL